MSMTFIGYFYYPIVANGGDKINIHGRTIDDDPTRAASELFEWLENSSHRHHELTKRSKILTSCGSIFFYLLYERGISECVPNLKAFAEFGKHNVLAMFHVDGDNLLNIRERGQLNIR